MSLQKRIDELEKFMGEVMAGLYTQPTALGPNKLSKSAIKAKSITGSMIDVTNLSSVNTNTGALTVSGPLTISTSGALRSGKTAYSDTSNAGFWLGLDSGIPRIRVGNAGHSSGWTWDGSSLAITGSITATTGTIGGWTIGSTDLTADAGATGIASSGSYRIWVGDATPGNAEFSVSNLGAIKATSGQIGGWDIDNINGFKLGTGSSTRGVGTGSIAFYAGSATPSSAPFNVSTTGYLNATSGLIGGITIGSSSLSAGSWSINSSGVLNAPNGTLGGGSMSMNSLSIAGTLTIGSGGKIIDADGSYWDQNGIVLVSGGVYGDSLKWKSAGVDAASIYATPASLFLRQGSGASSGASISLTDTQAILEYPPSQTLIMVSSVGTRVLGNFYPGNTSSTQSTYYITGGGGIISNGIGIGGMLGVSSGNTINLIAPGTGGSASNWSSFTTANVPNQSAGYFLIQVAGVNYRVPIYANG